MNEQQKINIQMKFCFRFSWENLLTIVNIRLRHLTRWYGIYNQKMVMKLSKCSKKFSQSWCELQLQSNFRQLSRYKRTHNRQLFSLHSNLLNWRIWFLLTVLKYRHHMMWKKKYYTIISVKVWLANSIPWIQSTSANR
jgi:hypothetical protein